MSDSTFTVPKVPVRLSRGALSKGEKLLPKGAGSTQQLIRRLEDCYTAQDRIAVVAGYGRDTLRSAVIHFRKEFPSASWPAKGAHSSITSTVATNHLTDSIPNRQLPEDLSPKGDLSVASPALSTDSKPNSSKAADDNAISSEEKTSNAMREELQAMPAIGQLASIWSNSDTRLPPTIAKTLPISPLPLLKDELMKIKGDQELTEEVVRDCFEAAKDHFAVGLQVICHKYPKMVPEVLKAACLLPTEVLQSLMRVDLVNIPIEVQRFCIEVQLGLTPASSKIYDLLSELPSFDFTKNIPSNIKSEPAWKFPGIYVPLLKAWMKTSSSQSSSNSRSQTNCLLSLSEIAMRNKELGRNAAESVSITSKTFGVGRVNRYGTGNPPYRTVDHKKSMKVFETLRLANRC